MSTSFHLRLKKPSVMPLYIKQHVLDLSFLNVFFCDSNRHRVAAACFATDALYLVADRADGFYSVLASQLHLVQPLLISLVDVQRKLKLKLLVK